MFTFQSAASHEMSPTLIIVSYIDSANIGVDVKDPEWCKLTKNPHDHWFIYSRWQVANLGALAGGTSRLLLPLR